MPAPRRFVRVSFAEPLIEDGWLALYRGNSWLSRVIQYGTGGPYSHAALLRRENGHADVLEMREFKGGRATPLKGQVERWPKAIDIFRPDTARFPEFHAATAVRVMRDLTSREYGYLGVTRLLLQKIPLVWRLWPLDIADIELDETTGAPFCSHAVAAACRLAGVDPVPRKADHLVTPNDLAWSMFWKPEFTLIP